MKASKSPTQSSAFIVGGYGRALEGIEAEIRLDVEDKYADEWNASGILRRWFLLHQIEREIAQLAAERLSHISPDSLF